MTFMKKALTRSLLAVCLLSSAMRLCLSPPHAEAQPLCLPNGNVDQVGGITPTDVVLALQHFLGTIPTPLNPRQQCLANVVAPATSAVTPADARCLLQ